MIVVRSGVDLALRFLTMRILASVPRDVVSTRRPGYRGWQAPGYRWLQELWRGFFVQLHSAFTQGRAYLQVFCAALTSSVDRPSRRRRACRGFCAGNGFRVAEI